MAENEKQQAAAAMPQTTSDAIVSQQQAYANLVNEMQQLYAQSNALLQSGNATQGEFTAIIEGLRAGQARIEAARNILLEHQRRPSVTQNPAQARQLADLAMQFDSLSSWTAGATQNMQANQAAHYAWLQAQAAAAVPQTTSDAIVSQQQAYAHLVNEMQQLQAQSNALLQSGNATQGEFTAIIEGLQAGQARIEAARNTLVEHQRRPSVTENPAQARQLADLAMQFDSLSNWAAGATQNMQANQAAHSASLQAQAAAAIPQTTPDAIASQQQASANLHREMQPLWGQAHSLMQSENATPAQFDAMVTAFDAQQAQIQAVLDNITEQQRRPSVSHNREQARQLADLATQVNTLSRQVAATTQNLKEHKKAHEIQQHMKDVTPKDAKKAKQDKKAPESKLRKAAASQAQVHQAPNKDAEKAVEKGPEQPAPSAGPKT